jgi:hypothetical protein
MHTVQSLALEFSDLRIRDFQRGELLSAGRYLTDQYDQVEYHREDR